MTDRFVPIRKTHSDYMHERFLKIRNTKIKDSTLELKDWVKGNGARSSINKASDHINNSTSTENHNDLDSTLSQDSTFSSGGEHIQSVDDIQGNQSSDLNESYNNNLYLLLLQNEILDGVNPKLLSKLGIPNSKIDELGNENMMQYDNKDKSSNKRNKKLDKKVTQMLKLNDYDIGNYIDKAIGKTPFKVLDAPNLKDDYYLNLLDWSSHDYLAVGLASSLYLWDSITASVHPLVDYKKLYNNSSDDIFITSINWSGDGQRIAIGQNNGILQIWDVTSMKMVLQFKQRNSRIGSISWGSDLLAAGGRDKLVNLYDVRMKSPTHTLTQNKQEVCGLKWSLDEKQLAVGGNDNRLFIWNKEYLDSPSFELKGHNAAVKALTWSPKKFGILVSGGGSLDGGIRHWNTYSGELISKIDTKSQIGNMGFSKANDGLITTHGYVHGNEQNHNHVVIWDNKTMRKRATLKSHTKRVIYLTITSNGHAAITGSGDETLRFWSLNPDIKHPLMNTEGAGNINNFEIPQFVKSMKLR